MPRLSMATGALESRYAARDAHPESRPRAPGTFDGGRLQLAHVAGSLISARSSSHVSGQSSAARCERSLNQLGEIDCS